MDEHERTELLGRLDGIFARLVDKKMQRRGVKTTGRITAPRPSAVEGYRRGNVTVVIAYDPLVGETIGWSKFNPNDVNFVVEAGIYRALSRAADEFLAKELERHERKEKENAAKREDKLRSAEAETREGEDGDGGGERDRLTELYQSA